MPECVFYGTSRPCLRFRRPVFYGTKVKVKKIWHPTALRLGFCTNASHFAGSPSRGSVQPNTSSGVVPAKKWELIPFASFCLRLVHLASYDRIISACLVELASSRHQERAAYLVHTTNSQILGEHRTHLSPPATSSILPIALIRSEQIRTRTQRSAKPRHIVVAACYLHIQSAPLPSWRCLRFRRPSSRSSRAAPPSRMWWPRANRTVRPSTSRATPPGRTVCAR